LPIVIDINRLLSNWRSASGDRQYQSTIGSLNRHSAIEKTGTRKSATAMGHPLECGDDPRKASTTSGSNGCRCSARVEQRSAGVMASRNTAAASSCRRHRRRIQSGPDADVSRVDAIRITESVHPLVHVGRSGAQTRGKEPGRQGPLPIAGCRRIRNSSSTVSGRRACAGSPPAPRACRRHAGALHALSHRALVRHVRSIRATLAQSAATR
jgi:hypothetical protein